MRILKMKRNKGIVKVLPESLDDLWHLFNIILEKDEVHAKTVREVKIEDQYSRPKKGRRVPVYLGVKVEKVIWDRAMNRLRIHGIVCEAPEEMNIKGSHHTLKATVDRPLTIVKSKWLNHQLERLRRACSDTETPLIVTTIDDEEYCIAVLRQYGVEVEIEQKVRLPGKLEVEKREKALQEFFQSALKSLRRVWMKRSGPIVILGPGFMKENFAKYVRQKDLEVTESIVDVKGVNSGGLAGIHEALRSGVLVKARKHIRIAKETEVMEQVLERLGRERTDVTYGSTEVGRANQYGAVATLLVADAALREAPDEKRRALEQLMKNVENKGGKVTVISTEHEAGVKLLSLGGVAALLRFSIG